MVELRRSFVSSGQVRPPWLAMSERSESNGGAEEIRTPDPLLAKQMLYQLSYSPTSGKSIMVLYHRPRPIRPHVGKCMVLYHRPGPVQSHNGKAKRV